MNEKALLANVKVIQDGNKQNMTKIPISETVEIIYKPTGSNLNALIASSEVTGDRGSMLIYVESGSQHGMLGLWDIPAERATGLLPQRRVDGLYDRDEKTREITAIYLKPEDVLKSAYFGTLDDLLKNPNIIKRKDEQGKDYQIKGR